MKNFKNSPVTFNNGEAGIARVTISSIEEKYKRNGWVIIFNDQEGSQLLDFQNYIDSGQQSNVNFLQAREMVLNHYWDVIMGSQIMPVSVDINELLDTVMRILSAHVADRVFWLLVNYGYGTYHLNRLERNRYVPFIQVDTGNPSSLAVPTRAYTYSKPAPVRRNKPRRDWRK